MKRLKQIAIDERNYELLRSLGKTSDSFNDVITELLRSMVENHGGSSVQLECHHDDNTQPHREGNIRYG
jgi:hypothetical protein